MWEREIFLVKKLFNIITNFVMGLFVWLVEISLTIIVFVILYTLFKFLPNCITSNIGNIFMILTLIIFIYAFLFITNEMGKDLKNELIEKYKNRKDNK